MMSPSFRGKGGKGSNSEEKNMPNSKMESGGWRWSEKKNTIMGDPYCT